MSVNFGQIFAKTLSPVQSERDQALRQLQQAAQENFGQFVLGLATELARGDQAPAMRSAAGLQLKNNLTAKDFARRVLLQQKWQTVDSGVKSQVKQLTLSALTATEKLVTTTAGQAIAVIAAIELPMNAWPELIQTLMNNVAAQSSSNELKQATLQTIGFLCEEVAPEALENYSNEILTAVVQGARKGQSPAILIAALRAMTNSLEFIRRNFDNPKERDFIMQVVCEATTVTESGEVVSAAFECLVRIMSLYYDHMLVYMRQALFGLTINGMTSQDTNIALQAIEFWSTVCDEEIALMEEAEEAMEFGEQPERVSQNFARAAAPNVVPVLLQLLTQQEEGIDEDEWTPFMAAATALSLFAECIQNDVVPLVVPFVEANITKSEWRLREASVMAFGSILNGPDSQILQQLITQAMPVLLQLMSDQNVQVKDGAAWTLGKICELHSACIKGSQMLTSVIEALLRALQDSPKVAASASWALMNLANELGVDDQDEVTYALSPFFDAAVNALLNAAQRSDAVEHQLKTSAYEALANFIQYCAQDCLKTVDNAANVVLSRLEFSIQQGSQALGADDLNEQAELQLALCSVVQSLARRLKRGITAYSDRIMTSLLKILTQSSKNTTTVEDVFVAIGVLINCMGQDFQRYADMFVPFLCQALQNHTEHQLCQIAVGVVGDLCRALNDQVVVYCEKFMTLLVQNLQSEVLHREVKPPILSCFGDISLAIESKFEPFLQVTMTVLQQAAQMQADPHDLDMVDYVCTLREGILEALTGIVQGFKMNGKGKLLLQYAETMLAFVYEIFQDQNKTEPLVRGAIGLLGDMADAMGADLKQFLTGAWVEAFFKEARADRSFSVQTREVIRWSRSLVKQVVSGP
ncbi:hypothetical protein MIR68_003734 [Amoeboaphelidium protococcarum]|nr:hypothetical protein MIR68_003734 [Amoeboaphelidium protococcarum]KAI3652933.1 hypothetical protein MP228_002358 [Amoeboaphelidium protococcarum]